MGFAQAAAPVVAILAVILTGSIGSAVAQEPLGDLPMLATDPIPVDENFMLLYYYFGEDPTRPGELVIRGEMQHIGSQPALAPGPALTPLDANGDVLLTVLDGAEEEQTIYLSALYNWAAPGDRVPVQGMVPTDGWNVAAWDSATARASSREVGTVETLDPTSMEVRLVSNGQSAIPIAGSIYNSSRDTMQQVVVYAAFYGQSGRFVGGCAVTDSQEPFTIPPGGSVGFPFEEGQCVNSQAGMSIANGDGPFTFKLVAQRGVRV